MKYIKKTTHVFTKTLNILLIMKSSEESPGGYIGSRSCVQYTVYLNRTPSQILEENLDCIMIVQSLKLQVTQLKAVQKIF